MNDEFLQMFDEHMCKISRELSLIRVELVKSRRAFDRIDKNLRLMNKADVSSWYQNNMVKCSYQIKDILQHAFHGPFKITI